MKYCDILPNYWYNFINVLNHVIMGNRGLFICGRSSQEVPGIKWS